MRRFCLLVLALLAAPVAAAPADAGTLVRYARSGGFAGFDDHVTVTTGGRVKVASRTTEKRFTLSERRLRALRAAVRDARFGSLRPRYGPPSPVSDAIRETVRHAGRTVVVETTGDPPARLERLLDRLRRLLSDR